MPSKIELQDILPSLTKLIRIPSVSGAEHSLAQTLVKQLHAIRLRVNEISVKGCGPTILATHSFRRPGPGLLLYGHMDTVEPVEGWTMDPFKPRLKGDRLYGLGAWDMKSGITAIMSAAKALTKLPFSGKIGVALSSDEELYSRGCDALVRSGLLEGFHAAICAEPTGLSRIEIGRRGRIVYEVRVKGKATHSAGSSSGVDAVEEASKLIGALKKLPLKTRNGLSGSISVLKISGGSEFLVTPESCELLIDRHLVPGETPAEALKQLKAVVQSIRSKAKFSVRLMRRTTPFMRPYVLKDNEPIISAVERATERLTGHRPQRTVGLSVTDENYLVKRTGIPSVTLGPNGGNYHSADEYVILPSVVDAANIYVLAAILFQGRQQFK